MPSCDCRHPAEERADQLTFRPPASATVSRFHDLERLRRFQARLAEIEEDWTARLSLAVEMPLSTAGAAFVHGTF